MNNIKYIMYFIKIVFILFIIKITLINANIDNYTCYKKELNIWDYNNKYIIKESILNNLTSVINYFDKKRQNDFSFTSPISYNNYTFGYCSVNIKNISTKYELLVNIVNNFKNKCLINEFSQGFFDNENNIRICYDLGPYLYIFKRKCYKSPKWF